VEVLEIDRRVGSRLQAETLLHLIDRQPAAFLLTRFPDATGAANARDQPARAR
jgi:hypothetical protein